MRTGDVQKHTNRLIDESSPYLLQHAYNPVDWFAWSEEAFETARVENKAVFLSIGYSTCHWCHVMERESFEDERIASIMNENFVNIKVDREQRPDIDEVYMGAVQMMTGGGGWPLSVFLTPQGQPFYGGTYFPPRDSFGRPGFDKVLLAVADAWKNGKEQVLESAGRIRDILQEALEAGQQQEVSTEILDKAYAALASMYDSTYGGFGAAPKFPQPSSLQFLLTYWYRSGEKNALQMVERTLKAMADGGIYDHLGGGFARYSTDEKWLVPHFEKMLYDQALLSKIYMQAYQITGKKEYAQVAKEIFDYVLRDMTDEQGGFYSAEDADSEGLEGKFYVWRKKEIDTILSEEESSIFERFYGVTETGNFEYGTNILNINAPIEVLTDEFDKNPKEIEKILSNAERKLFAQRTKRTRPYRDDKIITAWNGLMISSLAYCGAVLSEKRYIDAAEKAAEFVLTKLRREGRLVRFYRKGEAVGTGFLEDYSFMINALVDLYEATYRMKWLIETKHLAEQMIELFGDENEGSFCQTANDAKKLIVRAKGDNDGAVPSGNSMTAFTLLRLGRMTMDGRFSRMGESVLKQHGKQMSENPLSLTAMLVGLDFYLGPYREIIITGDIEKEDTKKMIRLVYQLYLPWSMTIFYSSGPEGEEIEKLADIIKEKRAINDKATAYICENYTCKEPVTEIGQLKKLLTAEMF